MTQRPLTPKQQRFVAEYLIDLNASAAARRAGYAPKRADAIGHENLRKPEIAAAVSAAQAARAQRTKIDADWLLLRLAAEADADLADLYDEAGKLLPVAKWPLVWRQGLVAGVETVREKTGEDAGGNPEYAFVDKVKLADRGKRLELIGRHVGVQAFSDKIQLSGTLSAVSDEEIDSRIAALEAKCKGAIA